MKVHSQETKQFVYIHVYLFEIFKVNEAVFILICFCHCTVHNGTHLQQKVNHVSHKSVDTYTHTHAHTHTHQIEANLLLWYVQPNHAGQDLETEEDHKCHSNLELHIRRMNGYPTRDTQFQEETLNFKKNKLCIQSGNSFELYLQVHV